MTDPIVRLPDWRDRLQRYLDAQRGRRFAYGWADCALFAAGAVRAMTGQDVARPWRGRYATLRDGVRLLGGDDIHGLESLATRVLGPSVDPAAARVGDIVSIPAGDRRSISLAVCTGDHVVAIARPVGLAVRPLKIGRACWRVGEWAV